MDLLPVTLDLNHGGVRVTDQFCWGAGADVQTVEEFSLAYCRERCLPNVLYKLVKEAVLDQTSTLDKSCSQAMRANSGECLERLSIDCCVGKNRLRDRVTWDIGSSDQQPEAFAHSLCRDLGLDRAFESQVAWQIRSQAFERRLSTAKRSVTQPVTADYRSLEDDPMRCSKRRKTFGSKRVCSQPTLAFNTHASGVVNAKKDQVCPTIQELAEEELANRSAPVPLAQAQDLDLELDSHASVGLAGAGLSINMPDPNGLPQTSATQGQHAHLAQTTQSFHGAPSASAQQEPANPTQPQESERGGEQIAQPWQHWQARRPEVQLPLPSTLQSDGQLPQRLPADPALSQAQSGQHRVATMQDLMKANHMLGSLPHQGLPNRQPHQHQQQQQQQQQAPIPQTRHSENRTEAAPVWTTSHNGVAASIRQRGWPGVPRMPAAPAAPGLGIQEQGGRADQPPHEIPPRMQAVISQLGLKMPSARLPRAAAPALAPTPQHTPSREELEGMRQRMGQPQWNMQHLLMAHQQVQANEAGNESASGLDAARLGVAKEGAVNTSLQGPTRQPLLSPSAQDVVTQQRNALLWQQKQQAADWRQGKAGRLESLDSQQQYALSSRSAGAFAPLLRGSPGGPGRPQPTSEAHESCQPLDNLHT
ncbi:hypothetical protein WJX74_003084 [Apatococcus lobatus]|uniref:Uncharacterized protein n=1 Tax=Apatococcus lobatus TaxID=904363 RepID=A0AAW1QVH7_9CHLO